MTRKEFLRLAGAGLAVTSAGGLVACSDGDLLENRSNADNSLVGLEDVESQEVHDALYETWAAEEEEWRQVRAQFALDPEYIHLAGLLIASHPETVRRAVEEFRKELNHNPAVYLPENFTPREDAVRSAAADYLGTRTQDVALTHNTTTGISLVYGGIQIRDDQHFLTTVHDYHATHDAIQYRSERSGADVRRATLYDDSFGAGRDEIVERLISAVEPGTRVIAITWVHSSTGVKLPIRTIADALAEINSNRDMQDRALLCVDGVHGMGVEPDSIPDLGCDFFMAGTHKWMFAPRGTGILWGNPQTQEQVAPIIPTFSRLSGWGPLMTPGGFHAFEHWWGAKEAFDLHMEIGKETVTDRIHALNRQFKEGVAHMDHVTLYTPMDESLSAGMVCFDIDGMSPVQVTGRLKEKNIIVSETPYSPSYARVSPGLINSPGEIERVIESVGDLG